MLAHTLRALRGLLDRRGRSRIATDGGRPEDEPGDDEPGGDRTDEQEPDQDVEGEEAVDDDRTADRESEREESKREESERTSRRTGEGEEEPDEASETDGAPQGVDRANVEITDAGEAEPAQPEWEEPDLDELPEFEIRADRPVAGGGSGAGAGGGSAADSEAPVGEAAGQAPAEGGAHPGGTADPDQPEDPAAGMPNTARAPGASRISTEGTEAYIVAVELCARLPDDVRLPEEAADLVPAAVEAELEQDVQAYAAGEFDNERPTVDTLTFEEVDGEVWLRLRIGVPPESFAELDPDDIRTYALERLEGVF
jgi:hypothetical protein